MTLIEALQKYRYVTNDSGKTVYFTDAVGSIIKKGENAFLPTVELFTSTGWERYATPLALPCKKCDEKYYYIDVYNKIGYKINIDSEFDCERYKTYNYFMYETIAQYVADKQLIQRIRITLTLLNKENPDREMLISEYINDNYKDVIDRIKKYEEDNIK